MTSRALLVAAAIAAAIAIVAADFTQPAQAQSDETTGRIVARLLADGRVEFGWQPASGSRVLPQSRYFPADATVNRWLTSSPVEVDGAAIGRINARLLADGRIEFAFTPTDGARILPQSRYFPHAPRIGRWLHSAAITIDPALTDDTAPSANPATFTAVSAGGYHSCGLHVSGAIECWGLNGYVNLLERMIIKNETGQSDAPAGSFIAVSVGHYHSCGLRSTGAIECWGDNKSGQLDAPPGPFIAISAGRYHSCGLHETGAVECWGDNRYGQTDAPAGRFSAVSAGNWHSCGLRETGAVECWGRNNYSQADAPAGRFSAVSAGPGHSCGLRETGAVECWGWNNFGQADAPAGRFSAVSAGSGHSCGLRESGRIECWGYANVDQIPPLPGPFTAISAGEYHSCGLRESGRIECWGSDRFGQTYDPIITLPNEWPPVRVFAGDDGVTEAQLSELQQVMDHIVQVFATRWGAEVTPPGYVWLYSSRAEQVAAGDWGEHPHASTASLTVRIAPWGAPSANQITAAHEYTHLIQQYLKNRNSISHSLYVRVAPIWLIEGMAEWAKAIYSSLRGEHSHHYQEWVSFYLESERELRNEDGQHENGRQRLLASPYTVGWLAVDLLAQLAGEQAVFDFWRQIGKNGDVLEDAFETAFGISLADFYATFDDYLNGDPPAIRLRTDAPAVSYSAVSAGGWHSCGLLDSGAVECWGGDNRSGEEDAPSGRFSAVSAGSEHSCGLRETGAVECWGRNHSGQTDAPSGRFSVLSAGYYHTCGLRETGAVECWGWNDSGEEDAPSGRFSAVSAGSEHSCGLRETGAVKCWGRNNYGETDAPSGRFSAVSAGEWHTCALRETGAIECWGWNNYGQADAPAGRFSAVSVGRWHSCGLRETGAVECWGWNDYGQADAPAGRFSAVSAGNIHSCGLRETGAIECWGRGYGRATPPTE